MINTKLWLLKRQLGADAPQKRLQAVRKLGATNDSEAIDALVGALGRSGSRGAQRSGGRARRIQGPGGGPGVDRGVAGPQRGRAGGGHSLAQKSRRPGRHRTHGGRAPAQLADHPIPCGHRVAGIGLGARTLGEQVPYYVATGDFKRAAMFGAPAFTALVAVLRGGSEDRRVEAAATLGESGDPSVVKPLMAALKDAEPSVRTAAANALARLGDKQVAPALLPLLKDQARNVRVAAINAVGQLGDRHALEVLMDLAVDPEWEVRTALGEALGNLGDARALPTVMGLLNDHDPEVRQSAAAALGRIGDESTIETLLMAMVDEHMGVRQAAARSLTMVDPYWERSDHVRALLPRLQEAMSDPDPAVQAAAAVLLRRLTGRSAAELLAAETRPIAQEEDELVGLFTKLINDRDECVRLAAVEALGRLELPECIPTLQQSLRDASKWVQQAAERGWRPPRTHGADAARKQDGRGAAEFAGAAAQKSFHGEIALHFCFRLALNVASAMRGNLVR